MEDTADIDVYDPLPIGQRGVPEIADCSTPALLTNSPYRPTSRYTSSANAWTASASRTSHTAAITDPPAALRFFAQSRDGRGVDVGEDHRHAQSARMAGQAGADSRAGPGVMTATPPANVSRALTPGSCGVLRERHGILGVEHHRQRGEHQPIGPSVGYRVGDATGHRVRHVVGIWLTNR